MNGSIKKLCLLLVIGLLVIGCEKKEEQGAAGQGKEKGVAAAKKAVAVASISLCAKCGQIKGSDKCCVPGAKKCSKCGLAEGSPACCKGIDFSKGDVKLCTMCGEIKGSAKCCKEGAEKCPKCGLNKGSIGCCKI